MSADRGFFGSKPFSGANDLLARLAADPVDWTL
jgi:uracil-DNA glycosylase